MALKLAGVDAGGYKMFTVLMYRQSVKWGETHQVIA